MIPVRTPSPPREEGNYRDAGERATGLIRATDPNFCSSGLNPESRILNPGSYTGSLTLASHPWPE